LITCIKFKGCYDINSNNTGKVKLGENVVSIENDIPIIRYSFDKWTDKEYAYVEKMQQIFTKSTHVAEVNLDLNTYNVVSRLNENKKLAVFVYVKITDDDVARCGVEEEVELNLSGINGLDVYQVCLKDNSRTLDTVTAEAIIKKLSKVSRIKPTSFALCSSPLSFNGSACLTAVKAREIMSKYGDSTDVALPSANHQCMNECGCIRYFEVTSDLEAPPISGKVKKDGDTKDKEKTTSKKPSKNAVTPWAFRL